MAAIDETLIVKVSILGMESEGIGVRGLAAPHGADGEETSQRFVDLMVEAFKEALDDIFPKVDKHLEEKYRK